MTPLQKFLDAAAGEGLVLNGIDAADLYLSLFGDPPAEKPWPFTGCSGPLTDCDMEPAAGVGGRACRDVLRSLPHGHCGGEAMTPDERHEDVVRRYPGGLNPLQFRHETLASADEDGKLDPPALADWFKQKSLLIAMWMDGLIELRGNGRDRPMWPWFITDKGRAASAIRAMGDLKG